MGEWNRQKQDRWVKIDETSEKEAFGWVRTSPGVAANWKYVNYLLTWPQNRQQGRGWEIGRPPPFSWQISELDARLWPSRVVRAPRPNQLPASNPSQDSTCQPNKQHLLSPSYIRRPSRQDHMLTSLVKIWSSTYQNLICWLIVKQRCKHRISCISHFLFLPPYKITKIHKYIFTQNPDSGCKLTQFGKYILITNSDFLQSKIQLFTLSAPAHAPAEKDSRHCCPEKTWWLSTF